MDKKLTFDDISIVPKYSEVESRSLISLNTRFTKKTKISIPIISSPMDAVTGIEMAKGMLKLGGVGIIHRFMSMEEQADAISILSAYRKTFKLGQRKNMPISAATGVTGDFIERAQHLANNGCDVLLIDVAHGHHKLVKDALRRLHNEVKGTFEIIAGSIATEKAARDLCEWGADAVRVGIGNGSLCETRIRTGVGVPQVSAIHDCVSICDIYNVPVIADGGIRYIGDIAKSLGLGADSAMLGSLLSGTKETPGEISKIGKWPNEQLFKKYRGSASIESKKDRGETKNVEGNSKAIPYKGKIKRIIDDITDGIRSAFSYVGANNIEGFQSRCEFVEVTESGKIEAQAHLM